MASHCREFAASLSADSEVEDVKRLAVLGAFWTRDRFMTNAMTRLATRKSDVELVTRSTITGEKHGHIIHSMTEASYHTPLLH